MVLLASPLICLGRNVERVRLRECQTKLGKSSLWIQFMRPGLERQVQTSLARNVELRIATWLSSAATRQRSGPEAIAFFLSTDPKNPQLRNGPGRE